MGILEDIAKDMEARLEKEKQEAIQIEPLTPLTEAEIDALPNLTPEQDAAFRKQELKDIAEITSTSYYKERIADLEYWKDPEYIADQIKKGNLVRVRVELPNGEIVERYRGKKTWKGRDTTGGKYNIKNKWWYENEVLSDMKLTEQEMEKIDSFKYTVANKERTGLEGLIWYFHKRETKTGLGRLTVGQVQTSLYNWLHGEYY